MPKILFLAAGNVGGQQPLFVAREERAIRNVLRATTPHEFEVVTAADAEAGDLVRVVTEEEPDIIHFAGHGDSKSLYFTDRVLNADVVRRIVKLVPKLWCVVLNACFSAEVGARLAASGVPVIVGMDAAVDDNAAGDFAEAFYRGLARSRDVPDAVEEARTQLMAAYEGPSGDPRIHIGNGEALHLRSVANARTSIRARINLKDGRPAISRDADGVVSVNFDLYLKNPPLAARSAVWRLHESYDEPETIVGQGMMRESTDAGFGFYLLDIDTEDDYVVEAFVRLPRGNAIALASPLSAAIQAHYEAHTDEEVARQGFTRAEVAQIVSDLTNGNLQAPQPQPAP